MDLRECQKEIYKNNKHRDHTGFFEEISLEEK